MKTVKIETFNGKQVIEQAFKLHNQTGTKKILGTALNRIFQFNDLLRSVKSSGYLKANDRLAVIISVDGTAKVDTYELNEKIGAKLSLGPSAKSKKRFATNLYKIVEWSISDLQVLSIEDLINSLEVDEI